MVTALMIRRAYKTLIESGALRDPSEAHVLLARRILESAISVQSTWQPIATAPKDGTLILVFDGTHMDIVRWEAFEWRTEEPLGNWFCIARGDTCQDSDPLVLTVSGPSHWMPLPAPPRADEVK